MSNKRLVFIFILFITWTLTIAILGKFVPRFLDIIVYTMAGCQAANWIVDLSKYIFEKKEK